MEQKLWEPSESNCTSYTVTAMKEINSTHHSSVSPNSMPGQHFSLWSVLVSLDGLPQFHSWVLS